jgi:hypothetical protein
MPKKPNAVRQQLVSSLIETRPTSWTRKVLTKDEDGKESVESVKVSQRELKFTFAQNMSEYNVERLAERWL